MTPITPTAFLVFFFILFSGILLIYWTNRREEKRIIKKWYKDNPTARKYPNDIEKKLMLDEHEQRIS